MMLGERWIGASPWGHTTVIGGLFNHKDHSMAANMKRRSELFARNLCVHLCACVLFGKKMNNKPQAKRQQKFKWNLLVFLHQLDDVRSRRSVCFLINSESWRLLSFKHWEFGAISKKIEIFHDFLLLKSFYKVRSIWNESG